MSDFAHKFVTQKLGSSLSLETPSEHTAISSKIQSSSLQLELEGYQRERRRESFQTLE